MIRINETALPAPAALSVRTEQRAGTAQYNTLGELVQDGMREKRLVEITWSRMAQTSLAALSRALAAGDFFTLVYPDPLSGSREMRGRAVERFARVERWQADAPLWADVKLTVEER